MNEAIEVLVNGMVQLHCPDHFPAEITTREIDSDGYAHQECPTGHTFLELT